MKYIINESQHKYIISEINQETIKTISHRWFKKQIEKGEDPHIEGSLLMFLGIKKYTTLHVDLLRELRHFLGDGAYEASISRGNKVYDTSDFPEISGGYDFNFEVKIVGKNMNQLSLVINVLPGGEVDLIMTDEGVRDLQDAMFDEEIGWEVKSEIQSLVNDILVLDVSNYTGYNHTIEKINFED